MRLTDTGTLVAPLDLRDPSHSRCVAATKRLPREPLATTWPCLTEAMYLLGRSGGQRYQAALWRMRSLNQLVLWDLTDADADRMSVLMALYSNVPMDLADASLVAVAESREIRRLFTIDSDFYIYVIANGSVLEVIP